MDVIGLKITSNICFNDKIDSSKAKEIMEEIENEIANLAQDKFNVCVSGKGEFIKEEDFL